MFDALLGLGIFLLPLPWAIRTFSEQTDLLTAVRITPLYFAAAVVLTICALVSVLTGRTSIRSFKPMYQMWIASLTVLFANVVFIGLMRANPLILVVQESIVMSLFLSGLILGASTINWSRIDSATLGSLAFVGIPGVVLGYLAVGAMDVTMLRRGTVYSASVILLPATFYMLSLARLRSKRWVFISVVAFATWVVLQLLFLKRAPLLRAGATTALALLFVPASWRPRRFLLWSTTFLILLLSASLLFITEPGREVRRSIVERFLVMDLVQTYIIGVQFIESTERYEMETFRFRESSIMTDNMSWPQRIYGIGAGGYISDPRLSHWDLPVGDRLIPSAKSALHVGAWWPFVKGGLLLFVVFHVGVVALLFTWPQVRNDALGLSSWVFLALNFVFSFVEGFWMQPGSEGLTFMIGAAAGYCILRASTSQTSAA